MVIFFLILWDRIAVFGNASNMAEASQTEMSALEAVPVAAPAGAAEGSVSAPAGAAEGFVPAEAVIPARAVDPPGGVSPARALTPATLVEKGEENARSHTGSPKTWQRPTQRTSVLKLRKSSPNGRSCIKS